MKPVERWVQEVEQTVRPDRVVWCDGSAARERDAGRGHGSRGLPGATPRARSPRLHPPSKPSLGRGPHRAPHLHRQPVAGRRRSHQQLDVARRRAGQGGAALRRRDEGPHDVRGALRDGPARIALQPGRGRGHGQPVRRGQHADHDAHGSGRPRPARCERGLRAGPSLHGRPLARIGASSSTFPRSGSSGASAPATAATLSSARSASPSASRASWRATRAGWPSTC